MSVRTHLKLDDILKKISKEKETATIELLQVIIFKSLKLVPHN